MSKVCTFTERLVVYGIKRGYVDIVRGPVREMMREISAPYARSFLEHTVQRYQLSEEDVMQMYSAIYAGSGKTKAEKEFYRNFICTWLEQDKGRYLVAIEKISKDMRKKIFAVEWYTRGAEKGLGDTAYHLAELYATRLGVPKDFQKAVEWYQVSERLGFSAA